MHCTYKVRNLQMYSKLWNKVKNFQHGRTIRKTKKGNGFMIYMHDHRIRLLCPVCCRCYYPDVRINDIYTRVWISLLGFV